MTKHKKIDQQFIDNVWLYYDQSKRDLPWRHLSSNVRDRVYQVVVSEVMLQQTQVSRVITKYEEWMRRFPTLHDASEATFVDVLSIWKGLGYNRRAKYLHSVFKI